MAKNNKKEKPLTPEEFKEAIKKEIETNGDEEGRHSTLDRMLCDLLTSLGYGEGVKLYDDADKWYA